MKPRFRPGSVLWYGLSWPFLLAGCSPSPQAPEQTAAIAEQHAERELDTQTEHLHQSREVLRYMKQQGEIEQQRLDAMDRQLDEPDPQPVPAQEFAHP